MADLNNHPAPAEAGGRPTPDGPPGPSSEDRVRRFLDAHTLLPQHAADLARSGITPEQGLVAGIRSVTDPEWVRRALHWTTSAADLGPVMAFPFRTADGEIDPSYVRVKPDRPRDEVRADGKSRAIKYESPLCVPTRAYFPPGVPQVLADPAVDLVVTEGEKKAVTAALNGFPAVGLVGVWNWQAGREKDAGGRPVGPRELIPDLDAVTWAGRRVSIVFDSDAAHNPNVEHAEQTLAAKLTDLGAEVRIVRLPGRPTPTADGDTKCGLDDYLVAHGADALKALIATAPPYAPPPPADLPADPPPPSPDGVFRLFRVGQKVRPSDRNNVGKVVKVLGKDRYRVRFVSPEGVTADKVFHAADLTPSGRGAGPSQAARVCRPAAPLGPLPG